MTSFVALLRAVNVGGTGKLPMADLRKLCEDRGFAEVRTYIASGNVVLESDRPEGEVKRVIEDALEAYAGRRVPVLVRTAAEMVAVAAANPFPDEHPSRTVAMFLDDPPPANALETVSGIQGEKLALGRREIYIAYGEGMADSRLRIPAVKDGTARNMRTVAALAEMAGA